ncbi:hypothetical protein MWH25_10380 [Natroniella acetigena]|uniref:hypothetical protein n=1 Tax=Natroniella acetigena TaxID=52004 RepID=UPI00200AAE44|nr:hypothetical protein [Natroniella acetigena]MCK8828137.1 hypothetical protein [Natroniella acetigena]
MNNLRKLWEVLNSYPEYEGLISANWFHHIVVSITQFFQRIILTSPTIFLTTEGFWLVYEKTASLSIVVIAFVWMKFAINKLREVPVSFEELLFRTITYAITLKAAPHIVVVAIKIFNRITATVIDAQSLTVPENVGIGSEIGLIFLMAAFVLLMLRLIWWYFERIIWLILYTVIIPVVLALRCSMKYRDIGERLSNKIRDKLVVQVVHALVLSIIGTIVLGVSGLNPILTLGCQIGALSAMNKMEGLVVELLGASSKDLAPGLYNSIQRYKTTGQVAKEGVKWGATAKKAWKLFKRMRGGV